MITSISRKAKVKEAVREVLYAGISEEGLKRYMLSLDRDKPNEQYGALLKACVEAAHIIETSFAQLKQLTFSATPANRCLTSLKRQHSRMATVPEGDGKSNAVISKNEFRLTPSLATHS